MGGGSLSGDGFCEGDLYLAPACRQTDICENITFLQLHLQAVTILCDIVSNLLATYSVMQ